MNPWTIRRTVDLLEAERGVEHIGILAYTGSARAHRVELTVMRGGEREALGDGDVRAVFLLGDTDRQMTTAWCTASGNVASVDFPSAAYTQPRASVVIMREGGGAQIPLYAACYAVRSMETDAVIDPDHVVPSLTELLAQIAAAEEAAKSANDAAAAANAAAQRLSSVDVSVTMLGPDEAADGTVTQTGSGTTFDLRIPRGQTGATGATGPQGPKGDKGDDGSMVGLTLGSGVFAMYVGEDGHLYLIHNDDEDPPPLSIDGNGHLIYTID